jgi:acyl carrier protein
MAEAVPSDEKLFDLIADEALVDRGSLRRDVSVQDVGLTSLDLISVLFVVEDKYGVQIDENDLKSCETLGDLVDQLKSRVAAAA